MGFGDFLGGFVQGTAGAVGERRQEKRAAIQGAVDHKQMLGKLVLEGLVSGRVRPEFGSQVLGELVRLSEPRQPERGFAGFMGGQQMPPTPQLDTMTGGGWDQAFYSPQELADRDAKLEIYTSGLKQKESLRWKVQELPRVIAELAKITDLPPDMMRGAAMQILFEHDFGGVQGSPRAYLNLDTGQIFYGQPDMMRGIVDTTTRQVVPNARPVDMRYQDNPDTGTQYGIDGWSGQVISKTPGVVAPRQPQMPFFYPQLGLAFGVGPDGKPKFTDMQSPLPTNTTAPQVNEEFVRLQAHYEYIRQAVNDDLAAEKDQLELKPGAYALRKKALQEQYARQWGQRANPPYASFDELVTRLGGTPARVAPARNVLPQATPAQGGGTDANGVTFNITPPK